MDLMLWKSLPSFLWQIIIFYRISRPLITLALIENIKVTKGYSPVRRIHGSLATVCTTPSHEIPSVMSLIEKKRKKGEKERVM
jgi:hypothetical protein